MFRFQGLVDPHLTSAVLSEEWCGLTQTDNLKLEVDGGSFPWPECVSHCLKCMQADASRSMQAPGYGFFTCPHLHV